MNAIRNLLLYHWEGNLFVSSCSLHCSYLHLPQFPPSVAMAVLKVKIGDNVWKLTRVVDRVIEFAFSLFSESGTQVLDPAPYLYSNLKRTQV
jgi:hypothetical protein